MRLEIRGSNRRAFFLLAASAAVYVVVSFGLLPAYDTLTTGSSTAAEKEQQLSKYRRALIRKGNYTQLLDQVRKNVATDEARFIRGDNPTLAAVELQTIVEAAAQKSSIELSQRSVSAARKRDDFFNEILMTVSVEGTPTQIFGFLAEIRNAPKFVTVRNAQVTPSEVLHAPPPKGDYKKTTRANFTIAAPLPVPVRKNG